MWVWTRALQLLRGIGFLLVSLVGLRTFDLYATERPYFIVYSHSLEEPGDLELAWSPLLGFPKAADDFVSSTFELEYGLKGWWTTEFYLDSQTTHGQSTLFTGYRWENRFRPLMREHWINPVLYFEFESLNGADKTMREVVGFDSAADKAFSNDELRMEHEHEMETKLILSSYFKGWNLSENILAVKNLSNEPWEFGYALGAGRPLALAASPRPCNLCAENLNLGIELYGGLGDRYNFGLSGTSHYLAPTLTWSLPNGIGLQVSPTFGLTSSSYPFLLRFGLSYELHGFGSSVRNLFR
jgi:hypothetical protein